MKSTTAVLFFFFIAAAVVYVDGGAYDNIFSAAFFFGDSTLDTGNNAHIKTPFESTHEPYGRDFPGGQPTGRFSNGRLVPDLVSSSLGLKDSSPAFMDPDLPDSELPTGVCFASAGSGYDELTSVASATLPVSRQVGMFGTDYLDRLRRVAGESEAARIVGESLVVISAGTNDFVMNYYDLPTRRLQGYNVSDYQDFLLQKLQASLKEMYWHGCRKFVVAGLPPVGCVPLQVTAASRFSMERRCADKQNADAAAYNVKLQAALAASAEALPGSKVVYQDLFDYMTDIIENPSSYGYEESRRGCCGTGLFEMGPLCNSLTATCNNISNHVFFDAIHPSERVYVSITDYIMRHTIPLLLQ